MDSLNQMARWVDNDTCVKCSLCVSACPVYRQDVEFLGPKTLGPDWFRVYQEGARSALSHVDDCTFCQLCEAACPAGVPIAHMIAWQKTLQPKPLRRRIRDRMLTKPHKLSRMRGATRVVPSFMGRFIGLSSNAWRVGQRSGLKISQEPFFPLVKGRGTIGLFLDCYTRAFDQHAVEAARYLMELWGYEVKTVPRKSLCCGAAAYAGGDPEQASRTAQEMAKAVDEQCVEYDGLVTLNATCDGTLRDEWPKYFDLTVRAPVRTFDEMAWDAPQEFWDVIASTRDNCRQTVVHTTCRGKVERGEGALLALAKRAGITETKALDLACCGAGGSYAFKLEHEGVARDMARQSLEQMTDPATCDLWVDSGPCAAHLEQHTGVVAHHPAVWLWQRWCDVTGKNSGHEREALLHRSSD